MFYIILAIIVLLIASLFVLFLIKPNKGRADQLQKFNMCFAHRGLHYRINPNEEGEYIYPANYVVENTIPAFKEALQWGFGVELDVQKTSDDKLIVFHDENLYRLCGDERLVRNMTYEELREIPLANSHETIPLFSEVLELIGGKVPLLIEIKPRGDSLETTRLVCEMLDSYSGDYCIQSFSPLVLRWLKRNRSEILRGQLSTNFKKNNMPVPFGTGWIFSNMLLNCCSRPDFISYNCNYKNHAGYWLIKKLFKPVNAAWTIRSRSMLEGSKKDFDIYIFDSFNPKEERRMIDLLRKRRSIRNYNDNEITDSELNKIISAALISPTGRNKKPVEFIIIDDKEMLEKLSNTRTHGSQLIKGANKAIVVIGDSELSDTWIEDCSIAMTTMQLTATQLNIGNCWVQVRGRYLEETGEKTADIIKGLLNIPDKYSVEAMLALGKTDEEWGTKDMPDVTERRVHKGEY